VDVVYLRKEISDKMREIRKTLRASFSAYIVRDDGSISEYMNDRSLNTIILNFSTTEILSNSSHFGLFMTIMDTKEETTDLVKEYYYGSSPIGWKLESIAKQYNRKKGRHILPKPSKLIQATLTTFFATESELHLAIYVGILLYSKECGVITEELLDALFGKLDEEDLNYYRKVLTELSESLDFVRKFYNFVLSVLNESDWIADGSIKLLKSVYREEPIRSTPFRIEYLKLFRKIELPNMTVNNRAYDEATLISRMINITFETLESMDYFQNTTRILSPETNLLISELKRKGIDITRKNNITDDPKMAPLLQSMINIIAYSINKEVSKKVPMLYVTVEERGA
jgi:hypothetical protein